MSKVNKARNKAARTSDRAAFAGTLPPQRRVNVRAIAILMTAGVGLVVAWVGLKLYQDHANQPNLLKVARRALEEKHADTALTFINTYLKSRPGDLDGLEFKSQVLEHLIKAGAIDQTEAIAVQNQILAKQPERVDVWKRLVELNLKRGNYRAAEAASQEIIKLAPKDAEAHRLLARSLEGLGFAYNKPEDLDKARDEYETAEKLSPGDVQGGIQLAALYRIKGKNPSKPKEILDKLVEANPKSGVVRLARYRFFLLQPDGSPGNAELAEKELIEAIKLAPGDAETRLIAAEFYAQRGDTAGARAQLAAIDPPLKNDLRLKLVTGLIELREQRPDDAIQSWRSGLAQTGGSDAELTWRLARVLLAMGRVAQAEPLMRHYHFLTGSNEPRPEYRYLVALAHLRKGRANEAIQELEAIRLKVGKDIAAQHMITLGDAYVVIRDDAKALETYKAAATMPRAGAQPWLSMARIQINDRPEEAIRSLRLGLREVPNDPTLLSMLSQVLWQLEMGKPDVKRDWTAFNQVMAEVEKDKTTAKLPDVVVSRVNYLASTGQLDAALKMIDQAVASSPSTIVFWVARVNLLNRLGRSDEALAALDAATKAAGEQAEFRVTRARLLLDRGETKPARETLVQGIDRVPRDQQTQIWKALGEYHQRFADIVNAREAFETWSRLAPDSAEPRMALLSLAVAANDTQAMEAQLDSLKAANGEKSIFWKMARAEMLLQVKPKAVGNKSPEDAARLDEAGVLIREVKAMAPRQPGGHVLEAKLMELLGRKSDAIASYKNALELRGGMIAMRPLIVLLASEGRQKELDDVRNKVAEFPPELDRLAISLVIQMGDADAAQRMTERMVQGDPEGLDTAVWKARVLNSLGKPREAAETLLTMAQQKPEDASRWIQLLMFQASQGETAAAKSTIETMKQRVKTDRPDLLWASCYRVLGERSFADESFKTALQKWPEDIKVLQAAIEYYEGTGRLDMAEPWLRRMHKARPDFDWARRRLALNLSSRVNDPDAWNQALELVGSQLKPTDNPDDRLLRAMVLSKSLDPRHKAEAISVLEGLAKEIPNSARLHEILAQALLRVDRNRARDHAAKAAQGSDATASAVLFYAVMALEDDDISEAERQLGRLNAIDANAMPTIELHARILHAKKPAQDADAVKLLRQAYADHKNTPDALVVGTGVLRLLNVLGLFDAAKDFGREVAQIGPRGQIAYAEFLNGRGQTEEARKLIDAAFKAGADADAVRSALGIASEKGSGEWLDQTDNLLSLALKGKPESVELLQSQAYLRHLQRNYADEIKIYEAIIARNPRNYIFLNNMAWTLSEEMNQPEKGLEKINEAIKKVGAQPHLADTRGVIQLRLGHTDEALKDLEGAVAALPSAPLYFHLARVYEKLGRKADVEKYRDLARKAGLKADQLQPSERDEAAKLIGFDAPKTAAAGGS